MKFKALYLIVFIFSLNYSFSQEKSTPDLQLKGLSTTKGIFVNPSIGLNFEKTQLQIGILIGSDYVNSNSSVGGQIEYLIFPNEINSNTFNFFFISSLNYFGNTQELNSSTIKSSNFQLTFGYGFNFDVTKGFYMSSNMGLGVLLEKRKFNFDTNDPTNKWGFAGLVSFGIGYHL